MLGKDTKSNSFQIPNYLGIVFVCITTVIMCYSYLIPVIPILIFFGMWLPLFFYKRKFILKPTPDVLLTLAFPFLCFISFLWSTHPSLTIYSGVQFLVMATCIIIMARTVDFKAFLQGLTLGISFVLLASLIFSLQKHGANTLSMALTGLFGSKNQLGFVSITGVIISILLLFSDISLRRKFIFAITPLFISLFCLMLSQSATSAISLIFTAGTISAAWMIYHFPIQLRLFALLLSALSAATITVLIIAFDIDVITEILNSFGKDATLTGRTYLWAEGIRHGLERPLLGHGYGAFWVPGNPPAEQYWEEFLISGKTGFNFHSQYIETFVITGFAGLAIVIIMYLYLFFKSLALILKDGLNIQTSLFFSISSLMLARSFSEVEIIGPFGLQCLIFYSLFVRIKNYTSSQT